MCRTQTNVQTGLAHVILLSTLTTLKVVFISAQSKMMALTMAGKSGPQTYSRLSQMTSRAMEHVLK